MRPFISSLRPSNTSLGYGLFLAINAASVWGGVFPFLPMEFQAPEIILAFFFSHALVYTASFFASTLGVYYLPGPTRRFMVLLAAVPYFLGWCFLIAAIYLPSWSIPCVGAGGALLGLGSAGFYMLWQRLFASQGADRGNRELIVGTAVASLLYFALYLIPRAITAFLIPLVFLPLFGLCIVLRSRTIDLTQPMFEDIPRQHPSVYRHALRDYGPSALCIGALGFCCGVVRALAIETPAVGSMVNVVSMAGSLIAALCLLFVWQNKNVRLNVVTLYRFVFPVLITAFLIMPLAGTAFSSVYAALLYAVYSVAIMLMMIQCAQASRDDGLNPVFIYGFVGGIVYLLHDVGFAAGTFSEQLMIFGDSPFVATAIVAIYVLGIMYFFSHGGFGAVISPDRSRANSIELISLNAPDLSRRATGSEIAHPVEAPEEETAAHETESKPVETEAETTAALDAAPASAPFDTQPAETAATPSAVLSPERPPAAPHAQAEDAPQYRDRISKQCALVQQNYRLSNRETEVMDLLVRGNTVAHIAEDLIVSENTVRTHSKRLYAKLDVHKRQELIDLVTLFNPADLPR